MTGHPVIVDRLALVTGASSGIGAATARLLATRGWRTLLVARRADRLRQLAGELSALTPSREVVLDLSNPDAIARTMPVLLKEHGCPQVLINNAGHGLYRPFAQCSDEDVRRMMQVHYFGPASLIAACLPAMVEQGRGHIINIASIAASFGPYGHAPYAAAKAALVALTQSLACEHVGSGVHFSYVLPGVIQTEFFNDPTYQHLQHQVRRHGVAPLRVARAIVAAIDRPRLAIFVPSHYRFVELIRAVSSRLALSIIRQGSQPRRQPHD